MLEQGLVHLRQGEGTVLDHATVLLNQNHLDFFLLGQPRVVEVIVLRELEANVGLRLFLEVSLAGLVDKFWFLSLSIVEGFDLLHSL